jgi:hypothetical protein
MKEQKKQKSKLEHWLLAEVKCVYMYDPIPLKDIWQVSDYIFRMH